MPPNPATAVLPIFRHILDLTLVMGNTPRRVLGQIHKYPLRMRRNPLTVHDKLAADIDILPNLALKPSADARFVENADPRTKRLERLQWLRLMVEPDENMKMGVAGSLEL